MSYTYPEHDAEEERLDKMVKDYNEKLKQEEKDVTDTNNS